MLQTTLVASSCAIVCQPRPRSLSRPRAPSRPMPVSSTAAPAVGQCSATLSKNTSTLGRKNTSRGSSRYSRVRAFESTRWSLVPATSTSPATGCWPCSATRTLRPVRSPSHLASPWAKATSTCWMITAATFQSPGRGRSRSATAFGPPVEAPTTSSRGGCAAAAGRGWRRDSAPGQTSLAMTPIFSARAPAPLTSPAGPSIGVSTASSAP